MLLQVEHVVFSPKEFNTNFKSISNKLSKSEEYKALFNKAFSHVRSDSRISKHTVTAALNAYVGSLRSFNSVFDQYINGVTNSYPQEAKKGFNLFMGEANCATCHFPPTFSGLVPPLYIESESEVLGVTTKFDTIAPVLDDDMGRGQSGRVKDEAPFRMRSFKTPTLRNIALTSPYMHNGAFETLEEVMHFYNHGGGAGLGLDVPHQTLSEDKLNLSQEEMNNIIAFMKTLTDTVGMTSVPKSLPTFPDSSWNQRKIGGEY
jgi:cytochrome c peroxidase